MPKKKRHLPILQKELGEVHHGFIDGPFIRDHHSTSSFALHHSLTHGQRGQGKHQNQRQAEDHPVVVFASDEFEIGYFEPLLGEGKK